MKQMMLDLMVAMMPFMMWPVYAAAGLLALGILASLSQIVAGKGGGAVRISAWLLVILGLFFLACQGAGMLLGAPPSINFADATKGDFDLKPFWQIGLGMFVPGLLLAALGRRLR